MISSPRTLTVLLASVILLSACGTKTLTLSSFDDAKTVTLNIEIADSPKEREKGLMNRTELAADAGMLFVFKEPMIPAFWMKDTKIPLDIIFFDPEGQFVNSYSMEPCTENPCPSYKAAAITSYALEVPKGFREEHGIGTGWKLDLKQVMKMTKPT